MFSFFKSLFVPQHIPEIGKLYENRDEDPFKRFHVRVLDVREGYVKYSIMDHSDSSCKIKIFNSIYKKSEQ